MKRIYISLFLLPIFHLLFSQDKASLSNVNIDKLWDLNIHSKNIYDIHPLKENTYSFLKVDSSNYTWEILEKHYEDSFQTTSLAQGDFKKGEYIGNYHISPKKKHLLIEYTPYTFYSNLRKAPYQLRHLDNQQESFFLFQRNPIGSPLFSPDDTKVAFVYNNNLYYEDIKTHQIKQITQDGQEGSIINGSYDWVYQEELRLDRAFRWDKQSNIIAYLKFDESHVRTYPLTFYERENYPYQYNFKYPKAGEENAKVGLYLYFLKEEKQIKVNLEDLYKGNDFYILDIRFSPSNTSLWILLSNREQNKVDLFRFHLQDKRLENIFSFKDAYYIKTDQIILDPIKENEFIWACDKDGYNHLYRYSIKDKSLSPITKGAWEVTKYYGYDAKEKKVYYQSSEEGSLYLGIYSIDLKGTGKKKLSSKKGFNEAYFNDNFSHFINEHSSSSLPTSYEIVKRSHLKTLYKLTQPSLEDKEDKIETLQPSFIKIPSKKGSPFLDAWMIKPFNFTPSKKYPLLIYVYGGPGSKSVEDRWNVYGKFHHLLFHLLAQKGYFIACIDNQGTSRKGRKFEKEAIYKNLGNGPLNDQIQAISYLRHSFPSIDKHRIGILGESFGGYLSSLAITKASDLFKMAIAISPVIDWRFYDTIYSERYMGLPKDNEESYKINSPLYYLKNIKGSYLLIHGDTDNNVHVQNSFYMAHELIKQEKNFDMFIYPNNNHNIEGYKERKHLLKKLFYFILEKL